ncbi:15234_t:CDS:2 [Acaulospora colombiana]|uniref:15234_t:CDS:1 n=1 Tax=Acaulospora colombiana TaxID=27376 RepID=A0ACA9LV07_9GLOM|nr:15234_t:CDS:2 [Acaulospora colombiana]
MCGIPVGLQRIEDDHLEEKEAVRDNNILGSVVSELKIRVQHKIYDSGLEKSYDTTLTPFVPTWLSF